MLEGSESQEDLKEAKERYTQVSLSEGRFKHITNGFDGRQSLPNHGGNCRYPERYQSEKCPW
jgi:hypothetical protein